MCFMDVFLSVTLREDMLWKENTHKKNNLKID